jgi:hypothetical protein
LPSIISRKFKHTGRKGFGRSQAYIRIGHGVSNRGRLYASHFYRLAKYTGTKEARLRKKLKFSPSIETKVN